MRRNFFTELSISLLLLISNYLSGQIVGSIDEYVRYNESLPGEKVYVHTDRSDYMLGDTIWFKTYSWFGYDQVPDTLSGVLYVDLINSEGKTRLQRKLLIQNGTSRGEFILDTTINPGVYTLRAYTRWMGNQNTGEPYHKLVTINPSIQNFQVECNPAIIRWPGNDSLKVSFMLLEFDRMGELNEKISHNVNYSIRMGSQLLDSGQVLAVNNKESFLKRTLISASENVSEAVLTISVQDALVTYRKQFKIPLRDGIDMQFFPEGGKYVNGLQNRIAFKAIGTDGLSREAEGTIEDEDGKLITHFKSMHKGMGSILITPSPEKEYFASLWYNTRKYVIPLPHASDSGSVMTINYSGNEGYPYLTLKQLSSEATAQKYLVGSAYGRIWFSALLNMTKDSCRLKIPIELLPEGVCRLTVLDNNFKPDCERLIYIDKRGRFKIEVTPDSSSYGTRSKVTLLIKATREGIPLQTDLSLAVVDPEQEGNEKDENGIVVYKLLASELKGYIEDPGYYFKDDSCTDHDALDFLMLTQGYREFLPDTTSPEDLKFQPERNFTISGNLNLGGSKSRERKYNYNDLELSLICLSETPYIGQFSPDSTGRFSKVLPLLHGKSRSILQATTLRKKPFYGEIFLDEAGAMPEFDLPLPSGPVLAAPANEFINRLQAAKKTEVTKNPVYGLMSVTLPEVTVTAKAKNWYTDFEPKAEKIAYLDSLDPAGNRYSGIYDLLVKEFGAHFYTRNGLRTILLPSYSTVGRSITEYFPIYVVNGQIYWNGEDLQVDGGILNSSLETLQGLHINDIKKVMVLPPGGILPIYYASLKFRKAGFYQSLVVIETYSDNIYRGDPSGIKTFILDGLDSPRQFYSPRYDVPHQSNKIYDGRATLHWEPSIRTDASGQAQVEFFTSDRKTGLKIHVNGIEYVNGIPGHEELVILPSK